MSRAIVLATLVAVVNSLHSGVASAVEKAPGLLNGAWEFVSGRYTWPDGTTTEFTSADLKAYKVISDGRFAFVTEKADRAFVRAAAGKYTLEAATYAEQVEVTSDPDMRGKVYRFTFRVDGEIWHHTGMLGDVKSEEVWRRVK